MTPFLPTYTLTIPLFRRLYSTGKVKTDGLFELIGAEGGMAEVEIGVFGGPDFVNEIRENMETNLPHWIARSGVSGLFVWTMEENYAIALKRKFLFA